MRADARAFVDTNVLVYAHDESAGPKRHVGERLLEGLWGDGGGCVSIQVLQELFVTLTRKIPALLDLEAARNVVQDFTKWTVHAPDADDVVAAIRLHERDRISFWDAMIVQSAATLGCDMLYSEDLNAGQRYEGVLVVNPFS